MLRDLKLTFSNPCDSQIEALNVFITFKVVFSLIGIPRLLKAF